MENCPNCNSDISTDEKICPNCGHNIDKNTIGEKNDSADESVSSKPQNPAKVKNPFSIVSFILGIYGLLINPWGLVSLLAIIFSALSLNELKIDTKKGKVLAYFGLILGILSTLFFIVNFSEVAMESLFSLFQQNSRQ